MSSHPAITYPADLPVSMRREEILAAIRAHPVVIVAGETGSGKTTQLPKMCLEAGLARAGRIGCTQPRRVAAMSVSRRVAEELGVTWGREVGCKMRFSDDTSRQTLVKFMTDGILLAEIQGDPLLRAYSALILDEAHERSLNIDFLLGHLQNLLKRRSDLRLLITSATIDTAAFSAAFGNAPVIEVSGRLHPVEIRHAPGCGGDEEGLADRAARAVEEALIETESGDLLVFMPTERDIRETRELLESTLGPSFEVLALYGRMPSGEQQRIFAPGPRRRVVVATNVAETSLTIPRIGVVIDTGLARVSRYNPRTRTRRLPVEAISQSSANQRAGRAGRVQAGLCIRLYAEDDFEKRPRFTQPEIQRSNLAEVILRLKAFRLGEVETFPFLNPPQAVAIRGGYQLLEELGALRQAADGHELTPLGRELARLPVDPTLGRMLLQAREEEALPELLVIAAGLCIPDPRERPEDAREAASTAHKAFAHPESDFLALLNLWNAAPPPEGGSVRTSRNALRRFCKANYLSLTRMREWRDLYRQLSEAIGAPPPPPAPGRAEEERYRAIHRSILSGLLAQVAQRKERNLYQAGGNREAVLFPGSGLYERPAKKPKGADPKAARAPKARQPEWIVAGEIVQTSQLFARTAAGIDPQWVVEIGAHLCRFRHMHPQWSAKAGRVLVWECVFLHGLELTRRQIDYGSVAPKEATELFIRGALVAGEARIPHRFFAENRALRETVEAALTRVRSGRVHDLDEAFYRFYAARLENVSSVHDLDRVLRQRLRAEPRFLCATEEDLISSEELAYDRAAFPDVVRLENTVLPLAYAYHPGAEDDGVTVRVPLPLAERLSPGQVEWMVPGLRLEQAAALLRSLPKATRKALHPLEPKIAQIAREFAPGEAALFPALSAFVAERYRVAIPVEAWKPLPDYLRPRVEVVDRRNRTITAGRDLGALREEAAAHRGDEGAWERAARRWEQRGLTGWSFSDLPESTAIDEIGGEPLLAYPGLACGAAEGGVEIRLFRKREEAEAAAPPAIRRLAERALAKDMAWLRKELRTLGSPAPKGKTVTSLGDLLARAKPSDSSVEEALPASAFAHITAHLFRLDPVFPLTAARFQSMLDQAHRELPLLTRGVAALAAEILALRRELLASPRRYPGLEADVERLAPPDFPARTPHGQLRHLPRYLKAVQVRADRAALNPGKDAEKARALAPFAGWEKAVPKERCEAFRWLLEEFRVSLFAQELGTAQPVSAQRLKTLGQF